jgi:hypothetical protein
MRQVGFGGSREFSKIFIPGIRKPQFPGIVLVEWVVIQVVNHFEDVTIVSGGADGVDTWVINVAKALGVPWREDVVTSEEWRLHGLKAGMLRNIRLIDSVNVFIAFLDVKSKGGSRGTKGAIEYAKKQGKLKSIYYPNGEFESFKLGVRA